MAPNLVELRMPGSNLEQLWSGVPNLGNLKYVDLRSSKCLTEISALSQAPNLVSVDLSSCFSLHQVPPLIFGIGDEPTSLDQNHNNCYCNKCPTLGQLKLDRCFCLKVVEKISGNLKELHLSNSIKIEELSSSICSLNDLVYLNLNQCSSLKSLPMLPRSLIELDLTGTSIEEVPSSSIRYLFRLMKLTLRGCKKLKSLPSEMKMLTSLTCLNLNECSSFDKLPVLPRSLIELDLIGTSIEEVPSSSIGHLFGLQKLKLRGCEKLKSLPSDMQMLASLTRLDLNECSSFDKLPVLPASLIKLDLTETAIEEVPSSSIEHLFGLEKLTLRGCKRLKSLPTGICKLKSLEKLELTHCSNLEIFPAIKNLSKLIVLLISNCKMLKSLPELPLSLELLDASGCTSLERIANSRDALLQGLRSGNHVITSMEFFYLDCLNLDQNMCNNIVSEFQLRTLDKSTKSGQPHVELNISDCPSVSICCPGNKIPMWFTHQSESASINIRLSPDWKNTNFLGFALCIVVANVEMPLDLWCDANFKTNNGKSYKCFWDLNHNHRTEFLDFNSSNLFMLYKPEYYHNCLDIADVSFCFSADIEKNIVRACGVRPLYLQDAKELGITNELGKSNATSTGAVTRTSVEPHL